MDNPTTFDLISGKLWLHEHQVVPSTPNKKVKMLIKRQVVTIEGDNLCAIITNKGPVLEIGHNHNYEELYNFETIITLKKDPAPFDFYPYRNLNVNVILKK